MNKIQILLGTCIVFSSEVMASDAAPQEEKAIIEQADQGDQTDPNLVKAVEEALNAVKKESPQVHEDSLRVWKNFQSNSKPDFTYRFWGRRLILWLKEKKGLVFDSEKKVGDVFKILWRKGLISKNAVVVLMVDAWSHLVYLEGSPSWEKRIENRELEGGTAPNASPQLSSGQPSSKEQAV